MKGFDSYGNKEHETKQGLKTSSCECAEFRVILEHANVEV